jgi:hypothetical protein
MTEAARDALNGLTTLIPAATCIHDLHHRKHHGHLDQHTDYSRQCRARLEAEQADRGSDRELEEVAGADQSRWASHAVRLPGGSIQQIRETRVEVDLDQDRHGKQRNDDRLSEDLLALKGE